MRTTVYTVTTTLVATRQNDLSYPGNREAVCSTLRNRRNEDLLRALRRLAHNQ